MEMEKKIYVVLSQTGTVLSKALKFFTRAEYNHASISLTPSLEKMYSFGRLYANNPFIGGFVEEGINKGTFKRFKQTKSLVFSLKVSEETYNSISYFIDYFLLHKHTFHYNYWGVVLAIFRMNYKPSKKFYCSQFVRDCLAIFGIENANKLPKIIKPIDFLKLDNKEIVYTGLLKNYLPVM